MIITLSIPDTVYQQFLEHSRTNPSKAMENSLKRFAEFKPEDRVMVFSKAQQARFDAIFQKPTEDIDKLIDKVEELVEIQADKVKIPLSQGQQKRLSTEAAFYKKEYPVWAKTRLKQILDQELGA